MPHPVMNAVYNQVLRGLPLLGTPEEVAERIRQGAPSREAAEERLVTLYTGLSGMTGFVLGLPGWFAMLLTVPADLAGTAALQLHMVAALAALADHDLERPAVRDRCVQCVLTQVATTEESSDEEEVAARTGLKLAERGARIAAQEAVSYGRKRLRRELLERVGAKAVPVVGGLLSAGSDAYLTTRIGNCARETFAAWDGAPEEPGEKASAEEASGAEGPAAAPGSPAPAPAG